MKLEKFTRAKEIDNTISFLEDSIRQIEIARDSELFKNMMSIELKRFSSEYKPENYSEIIIEHSLGGCIPNFKEEFRNFLNKMIKDTKIEIEILGKEFENL